MQAITPEVRLMTYDEAQQAGLHSRGMILEYGEGRTGSMHGPETTFMYLPEVFTCLS